MNQNNTSYFTKPTLLFTLILCAGVHLDQDSAVDLPRVETQFQRRHAREVLALKAVTSELNYRDMSDLRYFILSTVTNYLPKNQKHFAHRVAKAVIVEANRNHLDPLFLLAVIKTESKFNITSVGNAGEIGLMQILPKTAKWLGPKIGIQKIDLRDPSTNIRFGAFYLANLRKRFKIKSSRYIAAYNMGARNVRRLVAKKIEPAAYPTRVLANYKHIYQTLESPSINLFEPIALAD